jgi:hypothetical protein
MGRLIIRNNGFWFLIYTINLSWEANSPLIIKLTSFISGTMAKFKYATNIQKRPAQENDLSKSLVLR